MSGGDTAWCEARLMGAALALGARDVAGWSPGEDALAAGALEVPARAARAIRDRIRAGHDPLGDAFAGLRPPAVRRRLGATYTPQALVAAMLRWARARGRPQRVVDPGAGSARFLIAAGREFPRAELVGVEIDPLAAALARAGLAASGFADRARVAVADYRDAPLRAQLRTLFIGNPPYVRHHHIEPRWKRWLVERATELGLDASRLAGLHVHFFVATALHARAGDYGAFVTAAEWLDVNYGRMLRGLCLGALGARAIALVEPTAAPFPDAATTAAVTCFEVGRRPGYLTLKRVGRVGALGDLRGGRPVARERLAGEPRWSRLTRRRPARPRGFVELGELCRVHRGQVTGANRVWIAGPHSEGLPASVLFPALTRGREIIAADRVLDDLSSLRSVIDLPEDLSGFDARSRRAVERFLRGARRHGAHRTYVARHRRAWWSVGLRDPAPILATYMARRPPAFARNLAGARHLNVAHGLYPREPLGEPALRALVDHLSTRATRADGRTYAGGLTKFEPREMERLWVPGPDLLDVEPA